MIILEQSECEIINVKSEKGVQRTRFVVLTTRDGGLDVRENNSVLRH